MKGRVYMGIGVVQDIPSSILYCYDNNDAKYIHIMIYTPNSGSEVAIFNRDREQG